MRDGDLHLSPGSKRAAGVALGVVLGLLVIGCSSQPTEEPASCPADTTELRRYILIPRCAGSGCHGTDEPSAGLNLAQDELEARVVGVMSEECAGALVAPGRPDESLLYQKVALEAPPCGERMPRLGPPLSAHEIGCLRRWIAALPPDTGHPDAAPPPDDSGSDSAATDAGTTPCGPGLMRCGDRCITEIRPTYASLHSRVFARSCTFRSCHAGSQPQEGLDMLDANAFYTGAVGVPSRQRPDLARIEPFAPERSYILNKLKGVDMTPTDSTASVEAERMPPDQPLCDEKVLLIEEWIRAGAPRD